MKALSNQQVNRKHFKVMLIPVNQDRLPCSIRVELNRKMENLSGVPGVGRGGERGGGGADAPPFEFLVPFFAHYSILKS